MKQAFRAGVVVVLCLVAFQAIAGSSAGHIVESDSKNQDLETLAQTASQPIEENGNEETARNPAPTPPANASEQPENERVVVSHDPQRNRTSNTTVGNRTTVTSATANSSVQYAEGSRPVDFSTEPDGERVNVTDTERWPYRAVVRLDIEGPDGGSYTCSGALVSDNHVLTAAHCVYLYDSQGNQIGWAEKTTVVPAANAAAEDAEPFGRSEVVDYRVYRGWTEYRDYEDDIALLTLDRDIGDSTGWFGYATYSPNDSAYDSRSHATGYPGDPPSGVAPTMWDHADQGDGTNCNFGRSCPTHEYWMITTDGQSGGPVWQQDPSQDGQYQILSVISRSYYSPAKPNLGTRITEQKFADISSWIAASSEDYSPDNRPELAGDGSTVEGDTRGAGLETGDSLTIHQSVRNKGTTETECFTTAFYLSRDGNITQSDYRLGESEICGLAPGESREVTWSGAVPDDVNGVYSVGIVIDSESEVSEYGEYPNTVKVEQRVFIRQSESLDLRSISIGETRYSILNRNDPSGFRGSYEPVTFSGQAGQGLWINMRSSGSAYVLLQNPDGETVASTDNGGDQQRARLEHELRDTGEYTVIVTSSADHEWYELSLKSVTAENLPSRVTRTIANQQPQAGATVPVTIEADLDTEGGIQIRDSVASNLSVDITDGFGNLDNVMDDEVTFNNPGGTAQEYEVTYEVTVPEDADAGTTYTFNGTAQSSQTIPITGDSTLTVQDGAWHDSYTDESGVVTRTGLNAAVDEYLSGALIDSELNTVIQSYLGGESVPT